MPWIRVLESDPGLIRVRHGKNRTPTSSPSWLGFGKKSFGPIDAPLQGDELTRTCCTQIFYELRAYLMCGR